MERKENDRNVSHHLVLTTEVNCTLRELLKCQKQELIYIEFSLI